MRVILKECNPFSFYIKPIPRSVYLVQYSSNNKGKKQNDTSGQVLWDSIKCPLYSDKIVGIKETLQLQMMLFSCPDEFSNSSESYYKYLSTKFLDLYDSWSPLCFFNLLKIFGFRLKRKSYDCILIGML